VSDLRGQCILDANHDPAAVLHGRSHVLDEHGTQIDRASVLDRHRDAGLAWELARGSDRAAVHDDQAVDVRRDDLDRDPMSLRAPMAVIDDQPLPVGDRCLDAVRCPLQHRDLLAGSVAHDDLAAVLEGDRPERRDRDHGLGPTQVRQGKQKR